MIPTINISSDIEKFAKWARFMAADQVPFATALALTKTAQDVKQALEQEMKAVLDRPTPYTLRGFRVFPAKKTNLTARIDFRSAFGSGTDARNYLGPQVFGGKRHAKAFEKALRAVGHLPDGWTVVPAAGARIDAFGNIDSGQIVQILSQLRITITSGYVRNMSFDARKQIAAQKRAGGRFFVVRPGVGKIMPGVYQRELSGRGITPVCNFVQQGPYRVRLRIHDIAQRVVAVRLRPNFAAAMRQAMATARA